MEALGMWLVPLLVVALLALPRPRRFGVRCAIAVLVGWGLTVLLFALGFDPSGFAADPALGSSAAEAQAGENLRVALFFGWVCPAVLALVFAGLRWLWLRVRRGAAA